MRHALVVRQWGWSLGAVVVALTVLAVGHTAAQAPQPKPNIVIIWGDDIGQSNMGFFARPPKRV